MRVVTFKIEEDLFELLDVYAINNGLSRSEAIRKAIKELVKSEKNIEDTKINITIEKGGKLL